MEKLKQKKTDEWFKKNYKPRFIKLKPIDKNTKDNIDKNSNKKK